MDADQARRLRTGLVIPAHPLALREDRTLDVARQRGLTRHYLDAGAGGLAVGVHTTQFEIRDPGVELYDEVLRLAVEEVRASQRTDRPLMVAGVRGPTLAALVEARIAADLGYDAALAIMTGWRDAPEATILAGIEEISEVLPVIGFYLQPTLSGRRFGYGFWRRLAEIPGVVAIKIAPFDRYATLDVVRAVVDAGRAGDAEDSVALYTGNDDTIVADLLTPYRFGDTTVHIVGGLLGQWAVGTAAAVRLHREIRALVTAQPDSPFLELLARGARLTDVNSAVFDVAHRFAGSIAGVNEVLVREGILATHRCLADHEVLSPGQSAELDRVLAAHHDILAEERTR
ncbi:dihydrodipicolinate synthase family protein [Nocardioides sp. LHD-245]|uniref:dihydrodipicolinate synthase family protein n=1 Tax=Nocardioides sp. LHD-245 TaxID=3051387 RepID=UPI0027E01B0B|nr:dihydrodipicolinate synthase family protein [Nocardioides sp. LHD-245]